MTADQACKFVVPFGKHKGRTLERIATIEKDAGYLDWMVDLKNLDPELKEALDCFLAIHWVKELVDRAVEAHRAGVRTEPIENLKTPGPWWDKTKKK